MDYLRTPRREALDSPSEVRSKLRGPKCTKTGAVVGFHEEGSDSLLS